MKNQTAPSSAPDLSPAELEALKAKIVEAVPEIMELKFGCRVKNKPFGYERVIAEVTPETVYYVLCGADFKEHFDDGKFEILGRDITLADVLLAGREAASRD